MQLRAHSNPLKYRELHPESRGRVQPRDPREPVVGVRESRAAAAAALRLEPLPAGMEVSHLEVDGDLSAEVGLDAGQRHVLAFEARAPEQPPPPHAVQLCELIVH